MAELEARIAEIGKTLECPSDIRRWMPGKMASAETS